MTVLVNGQATEVTPDATVTAVLAGLGYRADGAGLAVALNGEVVPRARWGATTLGDHDRLEVLGATQGG